MFGCNTHLLKHIKQAILVWSFRQNIFLGCCPVFVAISARDEFIVHSSTIQFSSDYLSDDSDWIQIILNNGVIYSIRSAMLCVIKPIFRLLQPTLSLC